MSRDGRFVAVRAGREIHVIEPASGREWTVGDGAHPRISPDGSSVLFIREGAVQIVPLAGGAARQAMTNVMEADWSPDGQHIAFVRHTTPTSGSWAIGTPEPLLEVNGLALTGPRWSPDGTRIAFRRVLKPGEPDSIFILNINDSSHTTIPSMPGGFTISSIAWLDNSTVVYLQQAGPSWRAVRLNLKTGRPTILFWTPLAASTVDIADGRLIFDAGGPKQNLREVDLDTGQSRAITDGPSIDRQPAYSLDGVLFTSNRLGSLDLWEWRPQGLKRLTDDRAEDSAPVMAADGKHFFWSSNRYGKRELWTADADGSSQRQFSPDGTDGDSPAVTPDGKYVLYQNFSGFHRLDADGTHPKVLDADLCFYPSVSPDSRYVACANGTSIRVLEVETGARVKFEIHRAARPAWMPDGRRIAFIGEGGLYTQEFAPGRDTDAGRKLLIPSTLPVETYAISKDGRRAVLSAQDEVSNLAISSSLTTSRAR